MGFPVPQNFGGSVHSEVAYGRDGVSTLTFTVPTYLLPLFRSFLGNAFDLACFADSKSRHAITNPVPTNDHLFPVIYSIYRDLRDSGAPDNKAFAEIVSLYPQFNQYQIYLICREQRKLARVKR